MCVRISKFFDKFVLFYLHTNKVLCSAVPLSPARPTRKFGVQKVEDNAETDKEMEELRKARAARLAFIEEEAKAQRASKEVEDAVKAKRKQEEERLAEEK